jgi:hypothetical protein
MVTNVWKIVDHPKDYPNDFVARKFVDGKATDVFVASWCLEEVQWMLGKMGLLKADREEPGVKEIYE